ncbi:unnamed protein product [Rotaria sp. Silwood1]|nr:unnamed protein product [Rotaria sp. Silwood1]CAF3371022.1 unnamed protein product [Rotaria sp. Silwood1]CAF3388626.1 unnamed protein product [Rotaria sp. Silwood1]CAF3390185.1 unnamed protein product [Rotaria sp. Silwood1]CAF4625533.1 unnamed protein product [Rotaria sp. Silwood1]
MSNFTSTMSSLDTSVYRFVPYRFFINESHFNTCKLEKLTNLFPEMKPHIELELFKINNLSRMVDRLSNVYNVLSVVDNRDDTLHLFLGPYHLSLGPAIFGALHFKNVSTALLASSHAKLKTDSTHHSHKRRRDAVLRRFRRTVRKVIFIKSIINQVRLASILTPYNQYELYRQGIYDLVLAGHMHDTNEALYDEEFIEQINNIHLMDASEKENSLLASKFIKINSLLHLLSPPVSQQQTDNNSTIGNITQPPPDNAIAYTTDENSSKPFISSTTLCCPQHTNNQNTLMFPISRTTTYQPNLFLPRESHSKVSSRQNSRKGSVACLKRSATVSLSDLTSDSKLSSDPTVLESNTSKSIPSSQKTTTDEEDAFVNNISSLLINYLSSQQSTSMPFDTDDNHKTLVDNKVSSTLTTISVTSNESDLSHQLSSTVKTNDFDELLQRIKITVDNSLSKKSQNNNHMVQVNNHHQKLSYHYTKTTKQHRRQRLFASRTASCEEPSTDNFNIETLDSSNNQYKLDLLLKLQSFGKTDLGKIILYDNSIYKFILTFTNYQACYCMI